MLLADSERPHRPQIPGGGALSVRKILYNVVTVAEGRRTASLSDPTPVRPD